MRILWLRPNKPPNVSVGRHLVAENLRSRGHEVTVRDTTYRDFITITRTNFDLIVGTTRLGAMVGAWGKLTNGIPLVIDHIDPITQFERNHGRLVTAAVDYIERITFRVADHVMVVYDEEINRVSQYSEAITKTGLGVDFDQFSSPSTEIIAEASRFLQNKSVTEGKRLVYIGSLEPIYQIELAIEAMEYLPDWEFIIIGDGSLTERIESMAEERNNVYYLGTVPHKHIPGLLQRADVGISLVDDRNNLKLLEYGAAGIPAVSIEGDAEKRFAGVIEFCEASPTSVAAAITRANESETIAAYQRLVKEYSWQSVTDQYEEVFETVIADTA